MTRTAPIAINIGNRTHLAVVVLPLLVVAAPLAVGVGIWGTLAVAYAGPGGETLRQMASISFALLSIATLAALFSRRRRWQALAIYGVLFTALLAWWQGIEPSNDRDW